MTHEEAINTLKVILEEATETEDSICYVTSGDADALKAAIKALEAQERLTEMLYKQITAYAEVEKSKHLNDLEYGNKIAYAHCLEVLTDDE